MKHQSGHACFDHALNLMPERSWEEVARECGISSANARATFAHAMRKVRRIAAERGLRAEDLIDCWRA